MYERKAIGFTLPPSYRHHYDQDVAAVQAVLGDEAMTAAWEDGRKLILAQAIEYATEGS